MHTPATGFLRSLPDTLSGIEAELVTKRERLTEDLSRVENGLGRVRAILKTTLIYAEVEFAVLESRTDTEALPFANLTPAETLLSHG